MKKRVLIIDTTNQFIRNYSVNPTMDVNGAPIGAVAGTLKTIQKLVRQCKPNMVVAVWDGEGGSTKRRRIQKDYKDGRAPVRKNYEVPGMTLDEEFQNRIDQQIKLTEYLNDSPVIQFAVPGIEADDVISLLTTISYFDGWQKVIVSSDADMVQLIKKDTVLYRPVKMKDKNEEILNVKSATEKYGIHPNNFGLAKALVGDKSDNVKGVPRLGMKTLSKNFPNLKESEDVFIKDIMNSCKEKIEERKQQKKKPLVIFENILSNNDLVENNYKVVQLYSPLAGAGTKSMILETLKKYDPGFSRMNFEIKLGKDGLKPDTYGCILDYFEVMVKRFRFK